MKTDKNATVLNAARIQQALDKAWGNRKSGPKMWERKVYTDADEILARLLGDNHVEESRRLLKQAEQAVRTRGKERVAENKFSAKKERVARSSLLDSDERKSLSSIRKLLRSEQWEDVRQGLTLAQNLSSSAVNSSLGAGIFVMQDNGGSVLRYKSSSALKHVKPRFRQEVLLHLASLCGMLETINIFKWSSLLWSGHGPESKNSRSQMTSVPDGNPDWQPKWCAGSDSNLTNLQIFGTMQNLTRLTIQKQPIVDLEGIRPLKKLTGLTVKSCAQLKNVDALQGLTGLVELSLHDANSVSQIDLTGFTSLETLHLSYCPSLSQIDGLGELVNLKTLDIGDCSSLENLSGIASLTQLQSVRLTRCKTLAGIVGKLAVTGVNSYYNYKSPEAIKKLQQQCAGAS
jgi:hypothetical protein